MLVALLADVLLGEQLLETVEELDSLKFVTYDYLLQALKSTKYKLMNL